METINCLKQKEIQCLKFLDVLEEARTLGFFNDDLNRLEDEIFKLYDKIQDEIFVSNGVLDY